MALPGCLACYDTRNVRGVAKYCALEGGQGLTCIFKWQIHARRRPAGS